MPKPIIGILSGSTRSASMNRKLGLAVAHVFSNMGAKVQIIDLCDYDMPMYNGDLEQAEGVPEAAKRLIADLSACAGVFISTPEYNGCMPALLKNSIDWTTRVELGQFTGPIYGIGSATPGPLSGIMALRQLHFILTRLGAQVVPTQLGVGLYGDAFSEDGRLSAASTLLRAEKLANQMLLAIKNR